MREKVAVYVSVVVATTASSIAYVVPAVRPTRLLRYYPLSHRWTFELQGNGVVMDWYGRTLLAWLVGLLAFALSALVRRRRRPQSSTATLWLVFSVSALIVAMCVYARDPGARTRSLEPLPAWYVPQ